MGGEKGKSSAHEEKELYEKRKGRLSRQRDKNNNDLLKRRGKGPLLVSGKKGVGKRDRA